MPGWFLPELLAEVYHPYPFESSSIPGPPLMNIHMAAAALYPVLCNYHFKGSQMLIRLEHDLKKQLSRCLRGL